MTQPLAGVCVLDLKAAAADSARGLFAQQLAAGDRAITALPVPIDPAFLRGAALGYPALGEDNKLIADRGTP